MSCGLSKEKNRNGCTAFLLRRQSPLLFTSTYKEIAASPIEAHGYIY
jgi:hypothetical protein